MGACRGAMLVLLAVVALGGCAAPSSAPGTAAAQSGHGPQASVESESKPGSRPGSQSDAPRPAPDLDALRPRTGGKLPPRVLEDDAAAHRAPPAIDRSCARDDDCAIKDVGSCCGARPDCVNVASPTNPAAVQAACAKSGKASICGFKAISACECRQGRCTGVPMTTDQAR